MNGPEALTRKSKYGKVLTHSGSFLLPAGPGAAHIALHLVILPLPQPGPRVGKRRPLGSTHFPGQFAQQEDRVVPPAHGT